MVNGRWNLTEVGRFRTPCGTDTTGRYQCWQLNQIECEATRLLAQAASAAPLASVGVDSWGVDYVLLDAEHRIAGTPVCYRDKRTVGMMERIERRLGRAEIYRRTGIQFLPFNTLYQLAACAEQEPAWLLAARHFLMIPDYLHFCLSGVLTNEYTNATTTQLCGLDGEWDEELLQTAGLPAGCVQPPIAAGTILGEACKVAPGVQVIAPATHDTASAVAGTPLESSDEAYISSGTWSLMGIENDVPIASDAALRMNFTNEGGLEGRFRVLKNIMGLWPLQRICEEQGVSDVTALVRAAAEEEVCRSVVDINNKDFLNPVSMTETLRAHCVRAAQPAPEALAQLARCIFDSLALSYRTVKSELETLRGRPITRIRVVGGGCQNELLNQLCADACGVTVVAGPVEASALGNLSAQMMALGALENLNAARAVIRDSFAMRTYQPGRGIASDVLERFEETQKSQRLQGEPCA